MKQFRWLIVSLLVISAMILSACSPAKPAGLPATEQSDDSAAEASPETGQPEPKPAATAQPVRINGTFTYSNDFVLETYYVEQAVALADMHGFVIRDKEWLTSTESQVLGFMDVDYENNKGTFYVDLPIAPRGTLNDVDNNGKTDKGVQIFAVSYWPNYADGPYSEGNDPTYGWPSYLASVKTDSENDDEVTAGKLLIWAPDDSQQFPSGFGDDGLLFTADDPVAPVQTGYSMVDLDNRPFTVSRDVEPTATLYEPEDLALKDYSNDSYTVAFDKMFEVIRTEYAFNGFEGKQPDWDVLYAELAPRVKEAEANKDPVSFYLAIRDYTWAFKDGHVEMSGGVIANEIFSSVVTSGYGMAIRVLDDNSVMVIYTTEGGPAQKAGMVPGDILTEKDGKPILDAIAEVQPLLAPFSTDFSEIYQQARYLMRAPVGTESTFTFINAKGKSQKATLKAVSEYDSYSYTSVYRGQDPNALPVEFRILNSGVGYVKVNSNYDDLNLAYRLFKRALDTFSANEVPGIIIDMRQNSGGAPLGFAGFFVEDEIPLGQLEYYSDATGKFEPDGPREKVRPYKAQYSFNKMALLVGMACSSACELDAFGLSQVPGMMVMGETPSAGVEAEVARGQFNLPEGIALQVPTGRFTLPDGSIFLEGAGVQLTQKVPVDRDNLLTGTDFVLAAAEQAILEPSGAGLVPSAVPVVSAKEEVLTSIQNGTARFMEEVSAEKYKNTTTLGKTYPYTITLDESQPLLWGFGWCAVDEKTLADNLAAMKIEYKLGETVLDNTNLFTTTYPSGDLQCHLMSYQLTDWQAGENHLQTTITFNKKINDGVDSYPKGTFAYDYTVYVKP